MPRMRRSSHVWCNRIFLVAVGLALASLLSFSSAQAADWVPVGAPEGGTVNRVIAGSGRVWAAPFTGGLFRSDDGAQSWRRVLGDFPISALTVDPSNPDLLLASGFPGLLRSRDGGRTWTPAASASGFAASAITFAPSDPRRVYLAAGSDIWRSPDRGATWKKLGAVDSLGIFDLAVDPRSPRIVHAAGFGGIFRSVDAGQTWTKIPVIHGVAYRIAVDPANPARVYASGQGGEIWRSEDRGRTWSQIADLDGNPITAFRLDPAAPGTLLAATHDYSAPPESRFTVLRSADHGLTWTPLFVTGEKVNDIAPAPGAIYLGLDVLGVVKSDASATSWAAANAGLAGTQVIQIVPAPEGGALYAAVRTSRDGTLGRGLGVWKSTDGGASWEPSSHGLSEPGAPAPYVLDLTADPERAGTLYAATGTGLFKTTDGGAGWERLPALPLTAVLDVAVDPFDSRIVYAIGNGRVDGVPLSGAFKSTDGGATWSEIQSGSFTGILIDLWAPGTLYLGSPQTILRSGDRGLTWTSVGPGWTAGRVRMVSGPNPGRLAGIAPTPLRPPGFDPTAPRPMINYLFDSFDGGAHWRNVALPGGAPAANQVMDLYRSPVPESPVYAASDFGVARLLPRARFWRAVGTQRFRAISVAVDPLDPSRIYAGTADGQVLVFAGGGS